jgi:capsular polysaccharide transport system permease protein
MLNIVTMEPLITIFIKDNVNSMFQKSYKSLLWLISLVILIFISFYWVFIASDRFVSTSVVIIQSPDIGSPELSFSSLMKGDSSSNRSDLLYLREHMLSMDMLKKIDNELDLKSHLSKDSIDIVSRLSVVNLTNEEYYKYFLEFVDISIDDFSGALKIKVQMFSPKMAKSVVGLLIKFGEDHMNAIGQRLAEEQVLFIRKQVDSLHDDLINANEKVLEFQNQNSILSPSSSASSVMKIIESLQAELSKLEATKLMIESYQSKNSKEVIMIGRKISSINEQISSQKSRLTSVNNKALNRILLDFEALKLKAEFSQQLYENAISTLESTRVESARKLKQVSILAQANLPEYSSEPKRIYNVTVAFLFMFFLTLIIHLIMIVISEHRD